MSFAGHVLDMIARDRYNRALRKSYRDRHNRIREAFTDEFTRRKAHDKKVSATELKEIKEQIRKTISRERRNAWIKTTVLTLIIALILGVLFVKSAFGQGIV